MRRDVIAVRVGNKRERLSIPGIKPDLFVRQIYAAVVTNVDHKKFYARNGPGETGFEVAPLAFALPVRYSSFSMTRMKFATIFLLAAVSSGIALAAEAPKLLPKVNPLPVALSDDFQFRKTKLFFLSEAPAKARKSILSSAQNAGVAEASMNFERTYRMYGAVTYADQRQRFGNYFDFFWRAKRPENLTVRLEYRQEKLRSFVQAREVAYSSAKGNHKTEFTVTGDYYFNVE